MPHLLLPALMLTSAGCGGCGGDEPQGSLDPTDPALTEVCARASGAEEIDWGDANADGALDVADAAWTLRALLDGGGAYACTDAQDLLVDELVDVGDALGILYHLYVGNFDMPSGSPTCEEPAAIGEAPCGRLGLSFEAPATVEGTGEVSFEVGVLLQSPDLAVQGWSYGVAAEGCTVTALTEAGTAIADVRLDEAGHRDQGFTHSAVVDGGLVHGALLSWFSDVSLPAQEAPWRLSTLSVRGEPPSSGCETCALSFSGELAGPGPAVAVAVSVGGRSYAPGTHPVEVALCSP